MNSTRWIAHLDMDAFFASVELLRYPALRGLPVVVGGRRVQAPVRDSAGAWHCAKLKEYVGRGVVTTATYEARALGVHSGMGLMKSAALAPDAILLPADFEAYRHYSRAFKHAVQAIAPQIEDRGIDEIYIDLSDLPEIREAEAAGISMALEKMARRIQQEVAEATGLSCSLGVTPNKLLSKLCSDLDKPRGVTILLPTEIEARIWPLPVRRVNGIGPKAAARLEALGIRTIGELAHFPQWDLVDQFGQHYGLWLHQAAHGQDDSPLQTWREPKSLSRETTFERDLHPRLDREALGALFSRLCQQLAEDLAHKRYRARSIGIKVRYADFQAVTRDCRLTMATADASQIRLAAGRCLKRINLDKRLRLLGVRAAGLEPWEASSAQGENLRLFD